MIQLRETDVIAIAAIAIAAMPLAAGAQSYPTNPVRIIVPFSPGGASDALPRLLGAKLTEWSCTRKRPVDPSRSATNGTKWIHLSGITIRCDSGSILPAEATNSLCNRSDAAVSGTPEGARIDC